MKMWSFVVSTLCFMMTNQWSTPDPRETAQKSRESRFTSYSYDQGRIFTAFTYRHVALNLYDLFSFAEHKRGDSILINVLKGFFFQYITSHRSRTALKHGFGSTWENVIETFLLTAALSKNLQSACPALCSGCSVWILRPVTWSLCWERAPSKEKTSSSLRSDCMHKSFIYLQYD